MVPNYPPGPRVRFDRLGFVLTAAALGLLVQGLSDMGGSGDTRRGTLMLIGGGVLALLSVRHAQRISNPMLDLRGVRVLSFEISNVTAGMLTRTAINSIPFFLPLMFQIGFGMEPFAAGMMLFAYMLGNLVMKSATTALLRRYGFYRILTVNGALCALAIGACGLLTPATAHLLLYAVLFFAGMTRSMNFTTVNTLAFADISPEQRPGASTLAAMLQQLSSTLAVAFSAWALSLSERWRGGSALALVDFRHGLLAAGTLMALGTLWTLRLPPDVGAEVSRHVH